MTMPMLSTPEHPPTASWALPPAQGLYDPAHERDACGVGFLVSVQGGWWVVLLLLLLLLLQRSAMPLDGLHCSGDGIGPRPWALM